MDGIFDVSWAGVLVSAFVSFVLGYFWYSKSMFGTKWQAGIGAPVVPNRPLSHSLIVEAVSCVLLSWLVFLIAPTSMAVAILVGVMGAIAVKSNDMFGGKNNYAIWVEAGYMLVKTGIAVIAFLIFT